MVFWQHEIDPKVDFLVFQLMPFGVSSDMQNDPLTQITIVTFLQVVVGILKQCIFFFFSHTGFLIGKHAFFFSTWFKASLRLHQS